MLIIVEKKLHCMAAGRRDRERGKRGMGRKEGEPSKPTFPYFCQLPEGGMGNFLIDFLIMTW